MPPPTKSHFNPSTASTVYIYCDGACKSSSHGPVAGYGVYINSGVYKVSICEPLPVGPQTSQRAELKGFWSALELVWALRPRHAVIISDSKWVTKGYNQWMNTWKSNGWKKSNGDVVAHTGFWKHIIKYPKMITDTRRMNLEVKWKERNVTPGQVIADALARQGCELNCLCRSCKTFVGREGTSHDCRPICRKDDCDGRIFSNASAYRQHIEYCHGKKTHCRRYGCNAILGSEMAAESHEDRVHNGYVFDCDYCDSFYQSENEKDFHEMAECDYAPFCRECGCWFGLLSDRNRHLQNYHGLY